MPFHRVLLSFAGFVLCEARRTVVDHTQTTLESAAHYSAEKYLKIVDAHLDRAVRQTFLPNGVGLLQTYGQNSIGGGDCELCKLDEPCPNAIFDTASPHCRFDVYDNALAAIYYTKRGKYAQAKKILDAFLYYLYPGFPDSLSYGPTSGDELPSGESLMMLAASYTDEEAKPGAYGGRGVADAATDLGNNAYAGMAFARYAAATGEACYATAAHDIMLVLSKYLGCKDAYGGFMGRLKPYPKHYRSIEHNVDMFAFAQMIDKDEEKASARKFVESMFNKDSKFPNVWVVGTHGSAACDMEIGHEPICTDAQMWNVAAGADASKDRARLAFEFTLKASIKPTGTWGEGKERLQGLWENNTDYIGWKGQGIGEVYHGFRFTNWGNGIQWENAASALVAMVKHRKEHGDASGLTDRIVKVRSSIKKLLKVYGSVPASVMGGNLKAWQKVRHYDKHPGGADTGMGWTYLRYPHLASTVWSGFALMMQGNEGEPVDFESNPYAPPNKKTPAPGKKQCIPKPEQSGAACALHPGCAGLGGDCCPTPGGVNLGCCS